MISRWPSPRARRWCASAQPSSVHARKSEGLPPRDFMTNVDFIFQSLSFFVGWVIKALIIAAILLMLVRLALNYADLNPFSRPVMWVRGMTDPYINPVRRQLIGFGFQPNIAPL